MNVLVQLSVIFQDPIALKTLTIGVTICFLSCLYRLTLGLYFALLFSISLVATVYVIQSSFIRKQLQEFIESVVKLKTADSVKIEGSKIFIAKGLDLKLEEFFNKILDQFIRCWWSNVSSDETFINTLKLELARAVRRLAIRYKDVDYAQVISTKLLPIAYTHFSQIEHSMRGDCSDDQVVNFFLELQAPHPATTSRAAELRYLRSLSESVIPYLFSMNNFKCRVAYDIVRELLTNWIFLQITDIIAEPDVINTLVILATNQKTNVIKNLTDYTSVELLESFSKIRDASNKVNENDQRVDGNFFKDQQKLYNFMQYFKSQNCGDVEILKFLLDVEHLNAELEKSSVISNPQKLSALQKKSEQLLELYRVHLFRGNREEKRPSDLIECYNHAKKYLECKWKYDFYKSADYYQYIYGERESFNTANSNDGDESHDMPPMSSQKLTAKIRSAIMKTVVDGGIEDDIQVYDAMDATSNSPVHYYNSMAVKLRKEKGQDLDSFMNILFQSIEQEADIGEDIVATQKLIERQRHSRIKMGNVELYRNLFNLSGQSSAVLNQFNASSTSCIHTQEQSLLYLLSKIIKTHDILLRVIANFVNFLPDCNKIISMVIRKVAEKLITQAVIAHLIGELQEKIFDQPSTQKIDKAEEQASRRSLAAERLEKIKYGISTNLNYLQNPTLNKHLVYSLLDVIITEGFEELNPNLMPK